MKAILAVSPVLSSLLLAALAHASDPSGDVAPACGAHVEKTGTGYRPEWHEREEECTVYRLRLRAVTTPEKYTVEVPVQPKRFATTVREVEHDQPCTRMVPVCVTDPCTGGTHTEYREETTVKKVKSTVIEVNPQPVDCAPTCKKEERTRHYTEVVMEEVPQTVVKKVPFCVMVPCEPPAPVGPGCGH